MESGDKASVANQQSAATLDYETPAARGKRPFTIGNPLAWWAGGAIVLIWSWPAWSAWRTADIDAFYFRGMVLSVGFVLLGGCVLVALVVRHLVIVARREPPTRSDEMRAWARLGLVLVLTLVVYAIDWATPPLRIRFEMHRHEFETARELALNTLPPGGEMPTGPIGPWPFVKIRRGANGVAFVLSSGSGIQWGNEFLLVPPGDGGSLGDGWRWEATD